MEAHGRAAAVAEIPERPPEVLARESIPHDPDRRRAAQRVRRRGALGHQALDDRGQRRARVDRERHGPRRRAHVRYRRGDADGAAAAARPADELQLAIVGEPGMGPSRGVGDVRAPAPRRPQAERALEPKVGLGPCHDFSDGDVRRA